MTFIGVNPVDVRHDAPGHPEHAERTRVILRAIDADPALSKLLKIVPDGQIARADALLAHTARLWLNLENHEGEAVNLDPDTYMVPGSREAALSTARLGCQAVSRALEKNESGFVVARPPGHHATRDRSMGFCLLNNVAIAAHYALLHGAKRVLVFDHDVHHGNGTQDIFYESKEVLYQSFHLDNHYPGTGAIDETGTGAGVGYTMNAPLEKGDGEGQVRSLLANVFLPAAREFKPDLILFSSGFDSLDGDPLGGLRLSAAFYGEMGAAYRTIQPRVVAFLEGGYQLDRIGAAAVALLRGLDGPAKELQAERTITAAESRLRAALSPKWTSLR